MLTDHEYAAIFPMLEDARLTELAEDIVKHGQREPITLYQGQILDGRNRYRACLRAGVEPVTVDAGDIGPGEALSLVVSLNLHRRHLTESQRAMVGARLLPPLEALAAERRAVGLKQNSTVSADVRERSKASEQAAASVNVSPRSVENAKAVLTKAEPEVVQAVERGDVAVTAAAYVSRMTPDEQRAVVSLIETGEAKNATQAIREVKKPHVTHNSGENEWYTPPEYIEAARGLLGGFDLDPASSDIANRNVRADRYFTAADDGLEQEWSGRVWMNPPYEKGLIDRFAAKMRDEAQAGNVSEAVILVNNATDTRWFAALCEVATGLCFPTGRIRFLSPTGEKGAPLQGQAILYIGPNVAGFTAAFADFGIVASVSR